MGFDLSLTRCLFKKGKARNSLFSPGKGLLYALRTFLVGVLLSPQLYNLLQPLFFGLQAPLNAPSVFKEGKDQKLKH